MFKLQAKTRNNRDSLQVLRKDGSLPAVFYGMGKKPASISLSAKEFEKVWKKAGESSTVTLETEGGDVATLIHDVQLDPVKDFPIHVDFLAIDINKAIRIKVPVEFSGISDMVKSGAGILVKVLHEIEIEALPKNLPHNLKADISALSALDSRITVGDLIMPEGVKAITAADSVVASIAEQKEEKAEEVAAPVDLSAIEVEKKGKKEEAAPTEAEPKAQPKAK